MNRDVAAIQGVRAGTERHDRLAVAIEGRVQGAVLTQAHDYKVTAGARLGDTCGNKLTVGLLTKPQHVVAKTRAAEVDNDFAVGTERGVEPAIAGEASQRHIPGVC